jgi:hypothetical protein
MAGPAALLVDDHEERVGVAVVADLVYELAVA